jgi:hypothetical protein
MEISDIQELKNGSIEITFAGPPDYDDVIKLTVTKNAIVQIKEYWLDNLSYGAMLKKKK